MERPSNSFVANNLSVTLLAGETGLSHQLMVVFLSDVVEKKFYAEGKHPHLAFFMYSSSQNYQVKI